MSETGRGYSLPYAVDRGTRVGLIAVTFFSAVLYAVFCGLLLKPDEPADWAVTLIPAVLMVVLLTLPEVADLYATLHIAQEGIDITLFGRTLRQFPAEQIRFLSAVHGNASSNRTDKIAVSSKTLEDLTELGYKTTPKSMRIKNPRWPGEFAESYLYQRSMTVPGDMNFMRDILWLDWDPERLQILRQMYPDAQWLDCTQKKIFDAQLKESRGGS